MRYHYLDHTADAKFEAFGNNQQELFDNCGAALIGILTKEKIAQKKKVTIHLEASSVENLLIDFLNELLFFAEDEGFLFGAITECAFHGTSIDATLVGDAMDQYTVEGHIKAVTYHDLAVTKDANGWKAIVVVDL